MRFAKITPIVAILALAACDNQPETTAEAPVVEEETAIIEEETAEIGAEVEQGAEAVETEVAEGATALEEEAEGIGEETAEAVDPAETEEEIAVITPEDGATAEEPATTAEATEVEPIVEGGGDPEVTVITPEAGETETATAPIGGQDQAQTTGAISATTAAMIEPGAYASDQLSLDLTEEGTFTLTGPGGDEVTGDWRVFDDTLTLSNASGSTGTAEFPMTCTVAEEGEGFRITAETGSCEMLDGQVFAPQG